MSARRETCSRSSRPGALPAACTVGSCRRHHSPRRGLRPRTELGSPYSPRAMAASVWRARRECVVVISAAIYHPLRAEPTLQRLRPRNEHRPLGPCPFQPVGLRRMCNPLVPFIISRLLSFSATMCPSYHPLPRRGRPPQRSGRKRRSPPSGARWRAAARGRGARPQAAGASRHSRGGRAAGGSSKLGAAARDGRRLARVADAVPPSCQEPRRALAAEIEIAMAMANVTAIAIEIETANL